MTKHLARELDDLHHDILSMCAMVEEMVHQAVDELTEPNYDRARAMAVKDDEIDEWDVRIEEECLKILAMHQPVATDLRRISSVLKIANELERVADLAVHIAERACGLVTWPEVYAPANLKEMAAIAGEMLRNSIDAYVDMDSGLARRVCSRDEIVDRLNREIIEEILTRMKETPAYIEPLLHLFSASRHVERVADHATNIAEDVVYLIEGEIIRHRTEL
jgi:phosphate transport system protein